MNRPAGRVARDRGHSQDLCVLGAALRRGFPARRKAAPDLPSVLRGRPVLRGKLLRVGPPFEQLGSRSQAFDRRGEGLFIPRMTRIIVKPGRASKLFCDFFHKLINIY